MNKKRLTIIALCLVLAGGFFFTGQYLFLADNQKEAIVDEGVFIGGVDVGGMNREQATAAVNAYLEELKAKSITFVGPKGSIALTLGEMGLSAKVEQAVDKATGTAKAGNLITRFMLLKDLESENAVIDMGLSIDKQVTANLIYNRTDELNIPAIDWNLQKKGDKFTFTEGKTGEEVDIVASVNQLAADISKNWQYQAGETQFAMTSHVTNPRGSEAELAKVKDVLGSFSTYYGTGNTGRFKNVNTGVAKINGTLLYPGDEFSAYASTSPYTIKNGYDYGGAYSNGELIQSIGGGICQVSTTLYNAAIRAEMRITFRCAHSMTVGYVNLSEDAAIAGTYKDLRFRNDYDFPVYIEGITKDGYLTFNIYGVETRDPNRTVTFETEVVSTDDPGSAYTLSSSKDVGYYKVTTGKYVGYTARLWKIISVNGVEQERIRMNRSTYKSAPGKITIGTRGATEEQMAIINAALQTKDDDYIKQVIANINKAPEPEPTPEETPTTPEETPDTPNSGDNTVNE